MCYKVFGSRFRCLSVVVCQFISGSVAVHGRKIAFTLVVVKQRLGSTGLCTDRATDERCFYSDTVQGSAQYASVSAPGHIKNEWLSHDQCHSENKRGKSNGAEGFLFRMGCTLLPPVDLQCLGCTLLPQMLESMTGC